MKQFIRSEEQTPRNYATNLVAYPWEGYVIGHSTYEEESDE